jgi:tetratricopeptide (TPR) repeat protein
MYDPERFREDADRYGIGTVILFHRWENRRQLAGRLAVDPAWVLVYADEVAVIFVRREGNDEAVARAEQAQGPWNDTTRAWLARPVPKGRWPAGRVEGTRAFAALLAVLGDDEGSAEQYKQLIALGISPAEEADLRLRMAKLYKITGRPDESRRELERVLQIDPDNTEAKALR